jgi:type IV secretory pathway VirD2 relaxase
MSQRENEFRIRPGRIRDSGRGLSRSKSFVGQVMRAARKAGHVGHNFGPGKDGASRSRFGRGRRAALSLSLRSTSRRVVTKARVVRHHGARSRSTPLSRHITYLKRDGVTRDGAEARMFEAASDKVDERAFAGRCGDDRHHFRFIISPEDAAELGDLRTFTRELMSDVARDLGTKLDWIAVDHWNTDNPHIHVLIRGRAEDGHDLVISRDYISRGFRDRAAERVALELGPRSEREIRSALEREVEAERWTSLDRALRVAADEGAGVADLRPGASGEDLQLRRLMVGRAAKLERLGLAEQVASGCWTFRSGIEDKLRDLSIRGDIIKTMHRAMSGFHREPDVSGFALHGDEPVETILGRLVERGLYDELKGSAYAIVDGVDGRTHHLRFTDLEMTGDAMPGAIVEARTYDDTLGRKHLTLAIRSDFSIEAQVRARGATWIDRQLIARGSEISSTGFGIAARDAMERRIDHLVGEGLARRQGQRVIFARDLLNTLRQRDLDAATARLSLETGLLHRPSSEGERVAGTYRQTVMLASGRFAVIDDGTGFQLVPWRPALEQHLGREVSGVATGRGQVAWSLGRRMGLGI